MQMKAHLYHMDATKALHILNDFDKVTMPNLKRMHWIKQTTWEISNPNQLAGTIFVQI